jgi:PAS domain S-box-containing protein
MMKASENGVLFFNVMQLLADGEKPIHDDISIGQQASQILWWAGGMLIVYFFAVIILFQRHSNREHKVRERNLEVTLRSIGDAVIATDIQGAITCMNPEAERLTGWTFEDAKGYILSDVFRVVNTHSGEPADDLVEQVKREKKIIVMAEDSVLIASNGNRYQIYENGAPIIDDSGDVAGVVLVFRDITQAHKLKNKVIENANRLQRIIDTSMDAVIVTDEQGMVEEWNPAAESIFGWSFAEIKKQPIHETVIPEELREQHLQGVEHLINDNQKGFHAKRIESLALHRDGHVFPIDLAMTSVRTEKGWILNAFIRDLTESKYVENLIKKKNVLLNEAQKMAKLGYWEFDLVEDVLEWSDEMFQLFCLDPDISEPSYELFINTVHPDDRGRVNAAYTESVENKTLYDIDFRIETNDCAKVMHAQCETTYDDKGNPVRSLGLVQDVTEFKKSEEVLIKQDTLLREVQRVAKLGYWELDLTEDTLKWSDEMFTMFGVDPDISKPSYELFINTIHPDDRERVDTAYSESLKYKTPYNIIHRIVVNDEIKIVHEQCKTTYDSDGNPLRSLGLVQDITERVNNLDELRLAATMFRTHAGILITEKDGSIVRVNPAFEEMTGYSSDEIIGKNPRFLQSGKQSEAFYKKMWGKIIATGMWQGELWNKRKDGTLYAEWLTITAVKNDSGEVTNYVGTM